MYNFISLSYLRLIFTLTSFDRDPYCLCMSIKFEKKKSYLHCISSSTLGVVEGVAIGCRKFECCVDGTICCCCCCGLGVIGHALLINAVTDIVGLSFFATLDMATHKHPHITINSLHFSNGLRKLSKFTRSQYDHETRWSRSIYACFDEYYG